MIKKVLKNFFTKTDKVFPKIDVLNSKNYSYFQAKVKDLLKYDIMYLNTRKQLLYNKFIAALTESDKEQLIYYYRCTNNAQFPANFENLLHPLRVKDTETSYSYEPNENKKCWYVNFADQHLFGFYHTSLFAQDEIQCAEHPLLPHIRSAAIYNGDGVEPLTIDEDLQPTPVLIKNVHRLGFVDTRRTVENKDGMYGNMFEITSKVYIDKMSKAFIGQKNLTNFICMAALGYGRGFYQEDQLQFLYKTALSSFMLAKELNDGKPTELHTGNWGCGAFGNNKKLITCIQLFAIHLSGIEEVTYHTFNEEGTVGFQQGKLLYEQFLQEITQSVSIKGESKDNINELFISFLLKQKLKWGQSDGN